MNIGINTRFLLKDKMEGFGWYTYEISRNIVLNHPEHTFYFFFDRKYEKKFVFAENVIPIVLYPPARHPFLFYLWFEFLIKKAIKKYNIKLFFSPDGYLSLNLKIPQIITIHDLNFEHYPKDLPFFARKYLKYFFPKFAKKAEHIITVSNYSKNDIIKKYGISENKISVIWNGCSNHFNSTDEKGKKLIRKEFELNKPYFLFVGSLHPRKNIIRLIESYEKYFFSMENPFDLVIVGGFLWNSFENKIKISNKIRTNIHLMGHLPLDKLTKITKAAEIFIYIPYFEGFGIPLVEAMKSNLPIICGNQTSLPEIVENAAILVNPFDTEEIVKAMIQLSLDENLREKYSKLSSERANIFSWENSAKKTWEILEKFI